MAHARASRARAFGSDHHRKMLSAILHTAYTDTRVRKTRAAKGPIKRRTLQHSGEIANAPFSSDLTALMLSLGAGTYSLHRPIHLIDRLDINFAEDVATTGMLVVLMATTHAIVDRLVFRVRLHLYAAVS